MHHHHQSQKHYVIIIIISSSSITRGASYLWLDHYYCFFFFVHSLSLSLSCFLFVIFVSLLLLLLLLSKRGEIVGQTDRTDRSEKFGGKNSFTRTMQEKIETTRVFF